MSLSKVLLAVVLSTLIVFFACKKNAGEPDTVLHPGKFTVQFEPKVGSNPLVLSSLTDTINYNYTTSIGESFNISKFNFYATAITLSGPNGESYTDELYVSATESKGYYKVIAGESSTYEIDLTNIPVGTYNQVTFTLGVGPEGVEAGATGGVLDTGNGDFWNWDTGYIAMLLEGNSPESPEIDSDTKSKYQTAIHLGGWKDIADNENFVNNLRTVTLDFGSPVLVDRDLDPYVHIYADILRFYNESQILFETTYAVHSPKAGAVLADPAANMFIVDHVHQ